MSATAGAPRRRPRLLGLLIALLALAAVLLAAALIYAAADGGKPSAGSPVAAAGAPRIVAPAGLAAAAAGRSTPLYWAGRRPGTRLELTPSTAARAYVRYLSAGAKAGDPRPAYLTVATYRLAHAYADLRANAKRGAGKLLAAPHGLSAWQDPTSPTSVYLAKPGASFQVEVYDPKPSQALQVALSPKLRPVPGR